MSFSRLLCVATFVSITLTGAVARGQDAARPPDANAGKRPVKVVIYPILVQTPLYGASINLPALPGGGGDESGDVSGSTDVVLNAAYLAGVLVETNRIFVEASGTWADISADRQSPNVSVKTRTLLFEARGGVRVFKGISVTGGVHHLSMDLDALLDLPTLDQTLEGTAKPGYWDPMIGVDWRGQRGAWAFQAGFEGGGFGVGTDVDLAASTRVDYRIGWFDMRFGYAVSHLEATVLGVNIGRFQRELRIKQTLHGPNFGIGIAF